MRARRSVRPARTTGRGPQWGGATSAGVAATRAPRRRRRRWPRFSPTCAATALRKRSLRNHPDGAQPLLDQLRPYSDGILGAPQPERMPPVGIQMHLRWNAGILQRDVVHQRLVDVVHAVRLGLEPEPWRRVAGDVNVRIEPELTAFGNPEMSWIQRHREIRTAAFLVGGIHG